jgi:hypothetical protein
VANVFFKLFIIPSFRFPKNPLETVHGWTALLRCCAFGDIVLVKHVLAATEKRMIDFESKRGHTALTWAATLGLVEVVKLLIAEGANPFLVTKKEGRNALMYAVCASAWQKPESTSQHGEVVRTLLAGAWQWSLQKQSQLKNINVSRAKAQATSRQRRGGVLQLNLEFDPKKDLLAQKRGVHNIRHDWVHSFMEHLEGQDHSGKSIFEIVGLDVDSFLERTEEVTTCVIANRPTTEVSCAPSGASEGFGLYYALQYDALKSLHLNATQTQMYEIIQNSWESQSREHKLQYYPATQQTQDELDNVLLGHSGTPSDVKEDVLWLVKLALIRAHRRKLELDKEAADNAIVPCPKCEWRDKKELLSFHMANDCEKRLVYCDGCGEEMPADTMAIHVLKTCPMRTISCKNVMIGCTHRMLACEQSVHESCHCNFVQVRS